MLEVVRKEFKSQRKKAKYELELRNLSILKLLKYSNIVELLDSYIYRDKHNFIFSLARDKTLTDLFKSARPSILQSNKNIILALSKLYLAVCIIHDLFFENNILIRINCYHNLKPQNVLIDDVTFLLVDFSLFRFKELTERFAISYKFVSDYYVAPKCENISVSNVTKRTQTISRASDI